MTIAERIRIEKRNSSSFDAVKFMQIVEDFFTQNSANSSMKVYGTSDKTIVYHNSTTPNIICVPNMYLEDASKLLQNEGFILYKSNYIEKQNEVEVHLI